VPVLLCHCLLVVCLVLVLFTIRRKATTVSLPVRLTVRLSVRLTVRLSVRLTLVVT